MIKNKKFNSFLGKPIYDQIVPKEHFLRKVNKIIDWIPLVQKISPCYKGGFQLGAGALNPVTIIKMLLLSYIYNISERQAEVMCNDNIAFKYFIEIAIDEKAPDHSTVSKFRTRIINHYKDQYIFEKLFKDVLMQIINTGIKIGNIQIIDSKHMNARVSKYRKTKRDKDDEDNRGGNRNKKEKPKKQRRLKQEIDPDAAIGIKGIEKKRDKNGKTVELFKKFFGYKANCSIENKNDIITSCILSPGNAPDGDFFKPLFWKDAAVRGIAEIYSADKGYDWGDHHYLLNQLDIGDAIILKDTRLKDDERYAIWHKLANSEEYKKGKAERFKIERTFGQCVNNGGMHDCRYIGKIKTAFQMYFTVMAYNIKKAVKALHGISPKCPAPAHAF